MCANTPRTPCRRGANWIAALGRRAGRGGLCARGRQGLALRLRTRKPHQRRQLFALRAGQGAHGEGIFLCGNRFDAWAQGTHAGGTDARNAAPIQRTDRGTDESRAEKAEEAEKAPAHGDLLLALVALLLAAARWGVPYAVSLFAQDKLDRGLAADAKKLYALIDDTGRRSLAQRRAWTRRNRRLSTA